MRAAAATTMSTGLLLVAAALLAAAGGENTRDLEISEGAPVGTRVGFIEDGVSAENGPPYLVIPVQGVAVDADLDVDQKSGEIRTRAPLDREQRASYYFVAVPLNGQHIHVTVRVLDENDNAPAFPAASMHVEFAENAPRELKRALHPARDADAGAFGTQRYAIVAGDANHVFALWTHREKDDVLYVELQVRGTLDRETTPSYALTIEALDGGQPPLRGTMTVHVTVQDVNDNPPVFNQTRYLGQVAENATVGTSILRVLAADADAGENGAVEYAINRRQSDKEGYFEVDAGSGLVTVNRPLDFEQREVHELVVVARDRGSQPLESTAFVSIRVTDVNDNRPSINLIFLSDDATPKISEGAEKGEFVARISVNDADSKNEYADVNVTLDGGEGHFGLTTRDSVVYLVVVSAPIDRERKRDYTLSVVATDSGSPPLHASKTFDLRVTDVNDNAPQFERARYLANVLEIAEPGTSVLRVAAADRDDGANSEIRYSMYEATESRPAWFDIDPTTGLITTRTYVDCDTESMPKLTVVATDGGTPALSSTTVVLVTIHDVNDNEPIFGQTFYNVTIPEDQAKGSCILKVSAVDSDCGVNAMVNYTLLDAPSKTNPFFVKSISGEICVASDLDYEAKSVYEFLVIATDRGGLSAASAVKITLTDVNDNEPVFFPREYRISFRDDVSASAPVAQIRAKDADSGNFGAVSYRFSAGNDENLFRIDRTSGEIFVVRSKSLSYNRQYALNVSATDGAGAKCVQDAQAFITLGSSAQFERSQYTFNVSEDASLNTLVGNVKINHAVYNDEEHVVRYFVQGGDPGGWFSLDPFSGSLKTATFLDYEKHHSVLLNVQAVHGNAESAVFTQVIINIEDSNDNAPEFVSNLVRLSVPENTPIGVPLLGASATDADSGDAGTVRYVLSSGSNSISPSTSAETGFFAVDPVAGLLSLTSSLDCEASQRHTVVITAYDNGHPRLQTNMTVFLEVQDVNDNAPVFEQTEYTITVSESLPSNSQILQIIAVDLDTGNNAKISYKMAEAKTEDGQLDTESFGVSPNSGWIFLKKQLDRERTSAYTLRISATDNGAPRNTATATVHISVSDYNDNDPQFSSEIYEFSVEENKPHGTVFGTLKAVDKDIDNNAAIRYSLIPSNSSFQINSFTGVLSTREPLDREVKSVYELVAEAKDQGVPSRSSRVALRIKITDVNDNAPVLDDPQEDVISVREEQPPGTEVLRVRATDPDEGYNATISYSILKGRDTDGYGIFTIDPLTGVMRTRSMLDHEERSVYRIAVAATDSGIPHKQTVRILRVEVLDVNDNRPTFSSSSLVFKIREDVPVGHVIGSVIVGENSAQANRGHITYKLAFIAPSSEPEKPFDMDRRSGSLVVIKELDRETCPEYRLEVRILDTSTNPQSSAVVVKIELLDVNDNAPRWKVDPLRIPVSEDSLIGTTVWNFSATDSDAGPNKELRYALVHQWPGFDYPVFSVDALTGNLVVEAVLDYEKIKEYTLVVKAMDQAVNVSERLSTSLTVQVIIQDTNDNAPIFISPSGKSLFVGSVAKEGTEVDRVIAVDNDSGENGRVTYAITAGNEGGYFALDRDSGKISILKMVTFPEVFMLNVSASDHGSPMSLASAVSVNVTSQAKDEQQLKFSRSVYRVNVSEDLSLGSSIFSVSSNVIDYSGNLNNLKYEISAGSVDDVFGVNDKGNTIVLRKGLDRETKDRYVLPLYVKDTKNGKFDSSTLIITILDVNDNAPSFKHGSCYPLYVPENMDSSLIHTVIAMDRDLGNNARIMYSIIDGNIGNRFQIDPTSGDLVAQTLDRETQAKYQLMISAQDLGSPMPLIGYCNITVVVEDENDNDPQFEKSTYHAKVEENVPVGTTVLVVKAIDLDLDLNAQIVYSLKNESNSMFRINNRTGAIITNSELDRETQSQYTFQVVATDSGRYKSHSHTANVQISIKDVNDNKPKCSKYPFSAQISPDAHVGSEVLKVLASDRDEDVNGEIVYKVMNDHQVPKFRINSNTGAVTTIANLAPDAGRTFYMEVMASDKGSPSLSTNCLVELKVDGNNFEGPRVLLRFQNASYSAHIMENTSAGENLLQVFALRSDGRRQKIVYSFAAGNENEAFEINSSTGQIRVRNSTALDYETQPELRLTLVAQTDNSSGSSLFAFAELAVYLTDQNDNAPVFTQEEYFASVLEGVNKGTFVIQLLATDADSSPDSRVLYHVVDGNHDNAFIIEPPSSNIIKTNIVLDAEIRNTYRLTVIATDDGIPQLTGTTTVRINVIDVNDNPPSFPPHSTVNINENTAVSSIITSVVANDVDTFPMLVYTMDGDDKSLSKFAIDRYSGRVVLKKSLDYETRKEYRLRITASDRKQTASTLLIINVTDENDNAPVFDDLYYQFALPGDDTSSSSHNPKVHATDVDSVENHIIHYSLVSSVPGFGIDKSTGVISVNRTAISKELLNKGFFDILVKATDGGSPPMSAVVPVKFDARFGTQWNSPVSLQSEYRISVRENAPKGKIILRLLPNNAPDSKLQFNIVNGNHDNRFDILSPNGDIVLLDRLDRETTDVYSLQIGVGHNVSSTRVHIIVEDVNDNAPQFSPFKPTLIVSENAPLNSSLMQFHATDSDLPPNSDVRYEIVSGDDLNIFAIDSFTGHLTLRKALDCDTGIFEHNLVVRASDVAKPPQDLPLSTLALLKVNVTDENDNEPKFPISEYLEFIAENEPVGVAVFTAKATDLDKGAYGRLNYSIISAAASGFADADDSWKLFKVNPSTGLVSTNANFDYETRSRYAFTLLSCDAGGRCAKVKVRVEIESKDEFHPQFTERTFRFSVSGGSPVGSVIGYVTATDRDKGPDGRIVYQLTTQNPYFKINRTTGAILVKKKLDSLTPDQDISLVVGASSGRQGSLTNMSVVEVAFDPLLAPGVNMASSGAAASSSLSDWLIVLLVLFIVVVVGVGGFVAFLHFKNRRQKNVNKLNLGQNNQRVDTFVDPGAFDTLPIRGPVGHGVTQFGPPKYDEIPTYRTTNSASNSAAATTSELSASEQSGSSGRGSAEDGEDVDEEIRMINEGQNRARRNPDDDNLSDVSVHNTQEYLARLGIINSHPNSNSSVQNENAIDMTSHRQAVPMTQIGMFDDDGANEADITNIIYAKLNDVSSERGGSSQDEVERNSSTGRATSSVDRTMVLDGYQVPTGTQPSMSGSLSSIVHSEEELTGSYNWDYLLDWGPQYQPLAHVFSEIARLKDDAASVKSGTSGTSSSKSKNQSLMKTVPPPLLTNVAPRSITAPVINTRPTITGHSTPHQNQMLLLPRSPISHDATSGFSTSAAMSPSFSPSLSPLAARSPSVSPMHLHTMGSGHHHHMKARHRPNESDIRI